MSMWSMCAWALFLLLCIQLASDVMGKCADPLHCYLETLTIPIPDICEELNGKELCITEFSCQGIYLNTLPSAYVSPTTLELGASGLGTFCSGNYAYGRFIKGTASVLVNQTDFSLSLFLEKEEKEGAQGAQQQGEPEHGTPGIPVSAAVPSCNLTTIVDVSFSGGLLDELAGVLNALIESALETLLCTKLPYFVLHNVTDMIQTQLDPLLVSILNSTASPPPVWLPHYVSWGDSIVSKVR
jgi:hypothetical protein